MHFPFFNKSPYSVNWRYDCTYLCYWVKIPSAPSLQEVLKLKIPGCVGANYKLFGTILLNDVSGSRVDFIEVRCLRQPGKINTKILQEWLAGKGKPCTWHILIKTLRDCEITELADKIEKTKV